MQKRRSKVVFKDYSPNQILLLPPSLEDMIDPNHPVKVVNQVIDSLDINALIRKYNGGGCSSYHPRLLLKLLVYGYLSNQYSSRKIEHHIIRTDLKQDIKKKVYHVQHVNSNDSRMKKWI